MSTIPATGATAPLAPRNGNASNTSQAAKGQAHAHQGDHHGVCIDFRFAAMLTDFRTEYVYPRLRRLVFSLVRRAGDLAFAALATFAGSTAIASISNSAPGRANCEIATVVLAGGADMLKFWSRTSRKIPMCDMS